MPEVSGRKEIRKEVRFDGYTEKLVEALMATGDFSNAADLIRAAIQNLYAKYEAQQIPADLQSITPRILSRSVAKPEEQKSIKVSRRKPKKPEPISKEKSVEAI